MTTLTDFIKVDGVDYPLAAYFNLLFATALRAEFSNTETISATKELTDNDTQFQIITASGADRTIELAPLASTNHITIIQNAGSSNAILVKDSTGTTTYVIVPPGELIVMLPILGVAWKVIRNVPSTLDNLLINGSLTFAQRQTPGTLTTIAQDKYSADRFRVSRENADVQYQRVDALGEAGLTSEYYGTFKKITNAGKMMVYQPIEGMNSVPHRGKQITFQIRMKASASKTIRMAVLELQNAGTINVIPATFVSAWGANGTDPTLGSNLAIISSAVSKAVTTSMQNFYITVTVPSNSKNLIPAIWTDSQFSVNDTLSVAEISLRPTSELVRWSPRAFALELLLAQRYYWKTFDVDTAPVQNSGIFEGCHRIPQVVGASTAQIGHFEPFPTAMFKDPTFTTYNPAAANAEMRNASIGADCSATAVATTVAGLRGVCFNFTTAAGSAAGQNNIVHISADAEL